MKCTRALFGCGLQRSLGHLQRPLLCPVTPDEAAGVNEDAAGDPAQLRQRLVPDPSPLLQETQSRAQINQQRLGVYSSRVSGGRCTHLFWKVLGPAGTHWTLQCPF